MRRALCIFLSAFALCGARKVPVIHTVNTGDAEKLIRDVGAYLLDVRTPQEFAEGHIPGATLIPVNELAHRLRELPQDKTQPILVYCRSGSRSSRAAQLLYQSGRKDVYNLSGGIQAWAQAQKPIQIPTPK